MVTGALTMIPPLLVLKNGGEIGLEELERKCLDVDERRFGGQDLSHSIQTYCACLKIEEGRVKFDKEAKRYAGMRLGVYERELQAVLHGAIPNMEDWELYPFKTRKNSSVCNIGAPWEIIPKDEEKQDYHMSCDFRCSGEDNCKLGCGADEKYFGKN